MSAAAWIAAGAHACRFSSRTGPATTSQPPAAWPPDIIVILADDMGINDVSHLGFRTILVAPGP